MISERLNKNEKQSQAALVTFVDLLFLMVAFMVLLLVLIQERSQSIQKFEAVQEALSSVVGRNLSAPETLETLRPALEQLQQQKRRQSQRAQQRATRTTIVVRYALKQNGSILYEGVHYPSTQAFVQKIIAPLRTKHWLGLRASVEADTSFSQVVASRKQILQKRTPFDTYWDNL